LLLAGCHGRIALMKKKSCRQEVDAHPLRGNDGRAAAMRDASNPHRQQLQVQIQKNKFQQNRCYKQRLKVVKQSSINSDTLVSLPTF
jgi:hypothetical protein